MSVKKMGRFVMLSILLLPGLSLAADKPVTTPQPATPMMSADKEPIYGYQLMTPEERTTFRTQMQNATTPEERQKIRLEHRKQMLERAKAKGVTLPDMPMMNSQGIGSGKAMGGGMMNGNGYGKGKN